MLEYIKHIPSAIIVGGEKFFNRIHDLLINIIFFVFNETVTSSKSSDPVSGLSHFGKTVKIASVYVTIYEPLVSCLLIQANIKNDSNKVFWVTYVLSYLQIEEIERDLRVINRYKYY